MSNQAFILDRNKQLFIFEGKEYTKQDVLEKAQEYQTSCKNSIHNKLFQFLAIWYNDETSIEVRTSGSTGAPKYMFVEKERMMQSACHTCAFFDLLPMQKTLLCMPLDFIGAKMLVVRALVAGLDFYAVTPSLHPFLEVLNSPALPRTFDFIPMTPQQAWTSLTEQKIDTKYSKTFSQKQCELKYANQECNKQERNNLQYDTQEENTQEVIQEQINRQEVELFKATKHILLGGMAVGEALQEKIMHFPNSIWSSYGMTETLSHIALRKLNGLNVSEYFTPFKGIELSLSQQGTLNIYAPNIHENVLHTNDRAELVSDGRFKILGRIDNCINSGGIKIQIEDIENALAKILKGSDISFQITSTPDAQLGEKVVLLLLKTCDTDFILKKVEKKILELPKYWKPKNILIVDTLPQTESGKPDRLSAKEIANAHLHL